MLNLLRSDLYRCTRLRGFRGPLWQYLSVVLGVAILEVGLNAFVLSQGLGELETVNMNEIVASPSVFLGTSMLGAVSVVGLASAFGMVEYVFADLSDGYVKSLISSLNGRCSYFTEKIVFTGIWAAIMVAAGTVFHLICMQLLLAMPFGLGFAALDGAAEFALWLLGTWLAVWALTVIPLSAVLLLRKKLPVYVLTFILLAGVTPVLLVAISHSSGGILGALAPLGPALNAIASWMPNMVVALFKLGAGSMFDPAQTLPLIGSVPTWLWGALTGLLWTAIGGGVFVLIGRARDV
ncbi:MAG: hypothetical protein ACLTOP_01925 [Collinsella phocaeensis]